MCICLTLNFVTCKSFLFPKYCNGQNHVVADCSFFKNRTGSGRISAIGGNGFAGGGGGRVSVNAFSRHDDPVFLVHGEAC